MTLSAKILRIDKIGVNGQSAFVGILEDATGELRLFYATGIPPYYPPAVVRDYLLSLYTFQQLWDDPSAKKLTGNELQIWMSLWQAASAHATIAADLAECASDLVALPAATTAQTKTIIGHTIVHQQHILSALNRIISFVEYDIRTQSPIAEEAPGVNGS